MGEHRLKIMWRPFLDLQSGAKTGEVRSCADRDFQVGDAVELYLIDDAGKPTGQSLRRSITHIQRGYGLPDDICVLSYAQPSDGALTNEGAEPVAVVDESDDGLFVELIYGEDGNPLRRGDKLYRRPPAPASAVMPEGFMIVERGIWTEEQVDSAAKCIELLKDVPGMRARDLALAAMDAGQCKAPDISLADVMT